MVILDFVIFLRMLIYVIVVSSIIVDAVLGLKQLWLPDYDIKVDLSPLIWYE